MKFILSVSFSLAILSIQAQNDVGVYGSSCGFAALQPLQRVHLEEFVATKNSDSINVWLNHPNLVKQAYAVEGLVRLAKLGVELSQTQSNKIESLKNSNDTIQICSGQIYWDVPLKEALSEL